MPPLRRHRPLLLSLAFVASLLLSLLPTAGRLYQAFDPDPLASGWRAFCTAQGLALRPVDLLATLAGQNSDDSERGGSGHAGDDCPYCPVLASAGMPAIPALAALPPAAHDAAVAARPQPRLADRHRIGCEPRGPPVAIFAT